MLYPFPIRICIQGNIWIWSYCHRSKGERHSCGYHSEESPSVYRMCHSNETTSFLTGFLGQASRCKYNYPFIQHHSHYRMCHDRTYWWMFRLHHCIRLLLNYTVQPMLAHRSRVHALKQPTGGMSMDMKSLQMHLPVASPISIRSTHNAQPCGH